MTLGFAELYVGLLKKPEGTVLEKAINLKTQ